MCAHTFKFKNVLLVSLGDYVVEYVGQRLTPEEAKARSDALQKANSDACYIFEVDNGRESFALDATAEDGRMGRLINHSRHNANLEAEKYDLDGAVRLVFFATKTIYCNQELLYDYGDRRRKALKELPWLALA